MTKHLMAATMAVAILTALANPAWLSAQHTRYKLIDLGTFGGSGTQSYVAEANNYIQVLNDRGTVAGWADISTPDPYGPDLCFNEDCLVSHAFQTQNGAPVDLGVLNTGPSSAAVWISASGLVAGVSQNGELDPLIPAPPGFPGPPFFPEFRAVLWKNGEIIDVGTLPQGGNESLANGVNSRGVVVGFATNTNTNDPYSLFGFGVQTRAFRWDKETGMQDLGTLGTGTDAVAFAVNERGQIVGESYLNETPSAYCGEFLGFPLTTGAFLWENGKMKSVGNFGGTCTFVTDLNNRGEVVGISTLPGDKVQHAFLWKNDALNNLPNTIGGKNAAAIAINDRSVVVGWASVPGNQDIAHEQIHASLWQGSAMTDLGTLDGDPCSLAISVNASGQVVGVSVPACDFSQARAFLFEHGSIVDLNSLVGGSSPLYLNGPETINDRGEIAGTGVDLVTNKLHAFLLIPCSASDRECQGASADAPTRVVPIPAQPQQQGRPLMPGLKRRLPLVPKHMGLGDRSFGTIADSATFTPPVSSTSTGHCEYFQGSVGGPFLTGYCVGTVSGACRRTYDPGQCPVHYSVKSRGWECGDHVDLGRFCTP